jgi:ABC-2 type transport system ATP-binding protein
MGQYIIETINLSKKFYPSVGFLKSFYSLHIPRKSILALNSINLTVKEGEFIILIGPNGAGKTTLIKILSGLVLPTEGVVTVNGYDVIRNEIDVKKCIGLATGEERSFYWRLTGRQNLEFFAALHGLIKREAKKRIDYLLELLDIHDPNRRFQEYPTGLKQRFSIARSLLNDPKIIIMDEPTKNLDPLLAESLRSFIKKELVENRKKTIIFCTHNLSEAVALGGRIAIMDSGRIKACDSLEGLRNSACLGQDSRLEEVFRYYVNT